MVIILPPGGQLQNYLKLDLGELENRLWAHVESKISKKRNNSADRKAQIRKAFVPRTGLIFAFRSADFLRWCLSSERNLRHNLFFFYFQ